jgi:8-oxo-dGTP pyrophosphatase MutT (NUDIX family)
MKCFDHQPDSEKLGYIQWHYKALTTYRKGERQTQCSECRRWFFSWEMKKPMGTTQYADKKIAAVAYVERADGKVLCVWNKRYGCWGFPGGRVEAGESIEEALRRELREETGVELVEATHIHTGPHGLPVVDPTRASDVAFYRVKIFCEPREMEEGCAVTWLTQEEFLKWSSFAAFYKTVFEKMAE